MQKECDINNSSKNFVDICDSKFERNNFFYGKLMTVDDFKQEQNYFNDKRYLINRLINGTGVVCGLNLSILKEKEKEDTDNLYLQITSGCAIDCNGKEIVVPIDKKFPLPKSRIDELKSDIKYKNNYGRFGIFLQRHDFPKSPVPTILDNCTSDEVCCDNRIGEGYKIIPSNFEYPLKKIEFDNLVYDVSDKAKLELWDPDAQQDKVGKVTVSSTNSNNSITIELIIKSKEKNIFETKKEIQFTTNGTAADNKENQLIVGMKDGYDTITATYSNNGKTNVETYATVLAEKSFLFYKQEMINTIYRNENQKCSLCVSDSPSTGHVLIAVMQTNENNTIEIDNLATAVTKKTVYSNPLLFGLLERYKQSLVEPRQPTPIPTQPYTLVLSGVEQINIPKPFPRKKFTFSKLINFELPQEYESNLSIPLVYLGLVRDDDTMDYTEDMIYFFEEDEKESDYEYYDEKEKISKSKIQKSLKNIFPGRRLLFKPVSITKKSFRIILIRHRWDLSIEDEGEKLSIRWWATFPSILSPTKSRT